MKFDISVRCGPHNHDHHLEVSPEPPSPDAWRLQFVLGGRAGEADWEQIAPGVYSILVGGRSYEAHVTHSGDVSKAREAGYDVSVGARRFSIKLQDPRVRGHSGPGTALEGPQDVLAPMPGKIVKILVAESQEVARGEGLLVIEAMKMQNELRAERAGRVEKIYVKEGAGVEAGFKLLKLD